MQVHTNKKEKGFEPRELIFVIESQEEAQALYAIFNFTHNTQLLYDSTNNILEKIGKEFYVESPNNPIISNNVRYRDFYRKITNE